jgi:hypothetical protein
MLAHDHLELQAKLDAYRAEQTQNARDMTLPPAL